LALSGVKRAANHASRVARRAWRAAVDQILLDEIVGAWARLARNEDLDFVDDGLGETLWIGFA